MTKEDEQDLLNMEKQMRQRDLVIMRNEADKKGERRGIREEQERIIHTMMANGMTMSVIAKSLGLSETGHPQNDG